MRRYGGIDTDVQLNLCKFANEFVVNEVVLIIFELISRCINAPVHVQISVPRLI